MRRTPKFGMYVASVGALIALFGVIGGSPVTAITNPVTYANANVTTCAQVGFAGSTQYNGSIVTSVTATGLFTATVTNSRYVTISSITPGVVFQAVVIKGGDNYNVYSPILADMRAPLNNGGNVPALSHWFACYKYTPVVTTTTVPIVTTTTTPIVTTTTTPIVTTTTTPTVTTTPIVTTTTEDGGDDATTTTELAATTTTDVASEGPTTTLAGTTTTDVASEGPTTTLAGTATTLVGSQGPTTAVAGSLPRTGSSDVSGRLVLLGLLMVGIGAVMAALSRRPLYD